MHHRPGRHRTALSAWSKWAQTLPKLVNINALICNNKSYVRGERHWQSLLHSWAEVTQAQGARWEMLQRKTWCGSPGAPKNMDWGWWKGWEVPLWNHTWVPGAQQHLETGRISKKAAERSREMECKENWIQFNVSWCWCTYTNTRISLHRDCLLPREHKDKDISFLSFCAYLIVILKIIP